MKKLLVCLSCLLVTLMANVANADTYTFRAPATAPNTNTSTSNPNNPSTYVGTRNQFDLDHHRAYTWAINTNPNANAVDSNGRTVNLANQTITSATLTFSNMRNWDANPNRLFVHLLDTARNGGVSYFNDATGTPVTDIRDYFQASNGASTGNALVTAGTGDLFLGSRSFTNTRVETWTITFNAAQLAILNQFFNVSDRTLAFAFDPDCHFWNNGITFTMHTMTNPPPDAVPEPATMMLLGSGLAGMYLRRRRTQQQSAADEATL